MNASPKFATASTAMLWSSFNTSVKFKSSILTAGAEELATGAELEETTTGAELEETTTGAELEETTTGAELEETTTGAELEETTTGAELEVTTTGAELEVTTTGAELEVTMTGAELSELLPSGQPYSPGWWSQISGSISWPWPIQPAKANVSTPSDGIVNIFIILSR